MATAACIVLSRTCLLYRSVSALSSCIISGVKPANGFCWEAAAVCTGVAAAVGADGPVLSGNPCWESRTIPRSCPYRLVVLLWQGEGRLQHVARVSRCHLQP